MVIAVVGCSLETPEKVKFTIATGYSQTNSFDLDF